MSNSFESINFPGRFIRHRNFELFVEEARDDLSRKDSTFRDDPLATRMFLLTSINDSLISRLTLESAFRQIALPMNARSPFPANKCSDNSDLA